jgi:DNA helicase-2/ATP-dependent DNA helicase PcrA
MDNLALTWAFQRMRFGKTEMSKRSRFLDELDPGCIESIDRRSRLYSPSVPQRRSAAKRGTPIAGSNGPSYKSGQEVQHPNFGDGIIRKVEGRGEQTKLTVHFRTVGEKKLFAKFARLETLS